MNNFLSFRMALLAEQCAELRDMLARPLSRLAREALALRHAAITNELASLATFAAQEACPATAQSTREVAA